MEDIKEKTADEMENHISEKEKEIIKAYRNLIKETGSDSWVICNPSTMWLEHFIPISVIQNKIDEIEESMNKARPFDLSYIEYCEDRIEVLQELLGEGR